METCARVAEEAAIDRELILAPSEDRSGGRRKAAILGDACEAVIAALYLDGGLDAARKFVRKYWQPMMSEVTGDLRDPKNALQEWAQGRKLGTPTYRVSRREGPDHAPRFTVEVSVRGHDPAMGEGLSLRSAEQAAARDGDGMTNAQEFRAGTNPRDPLSVFRLAPPATVGADKTLSLANFSGRTYRIDFADSLGSPTPWRILADQIPGTGSAITITDPGAAALPQRFYRAVVEP